MSTHEAPAEPVAGLDDGPAGRRSPRSPTGLIPEAHGMPSAGAIVDDARLRFVLGARPDLRRAAPGGAAARARRRPGRAPGARWSATSRTTTRRCCWSVVGGYYTDKDVRERLGYPGQEAKRSTPGSTPRTWRRA